MSGLKPVFDTKADIIKFTLEAPMDYTVEEQVVTITDVGLEPKDRPRVQSTSSSDEEFVLKPKPRQNL